MAFATNTSDVDLEVPSLGVTLPAGGTAEVQDVPEDFDNPFVKVTKTKPSGADLTPWTYTPPLTEEPPAEVNDNTPEES